MKTDSENEKYNPDSFLSNIILKAQEFVDAKIDTLRETTRIQVSRQVAMLSTALLFILLSFTVIFLLNIALALWFGERLGLRYLGFLCVAGMYLGIAGLLTIMRKSWLQKPLERMMFTRLHRYFRSIRKCDRK